VFVYPGRLHAAYYYMLSTLAFAALNSASDNASELPHAAKPNELRKLG